MVCALLVASEATQNTEFKYRIIQAYFLGISSLPHLTYHILLTLPALPTLKKVPF